MRFAPLMVICDPGGALEGEKELIVGGAFESTSNNGAFPFESSGPRTNAVPAGVVMTIQQ